MCAENQRCSSREECQKTSHPAPHVSGRSPREGERPREPKYAEPSQKADTDKNAKRCAAPGLDRQAYNPDFPHLSRCHRSCSSRSIWL
jgi:hypothetical protein